MIIIILKDWSEEKEDCNIVFIKSSITVITPSKTHGTPSNGEMAPKKKETTFLFYFPKPTTEMRRTTTTPTPPSSLKPLTTQDMKDTIIVSKKQS
jgi:hypothetical protein